MVAKRVQNPDLLEQSSTRSPAARISPYFWVFLAATILWSYWDSIFMPFRSDHYCYLWDLSRAQSFWDILRESYSYPRTRHCAPGDEGLFRPVLFGFMAIERALFGYTIWPWQVVGIILHGLNAVLLGTLLVGLTGSAWIAGALTLLFAQLAVLQDAVSWQHIHGYLIYCAEFLGACLLLLRRIERNDVRAGFWACGLVALSAFTYELGSALALVCVAAVGWIAYLRRDRAYARLAGAFVGVPVLYQLVSYADYRYHLGGQPLSHSTPLHASVQAVEMTFRAFSAHIGWFFWPWDWMNSIQDRGTATLVEAPWVSVILLGGLAYALWAKFRSRPVAERAVVGVSALCLGGYLWILATGRLVDRTFEYLSINVYYSYMFAVFFWPVLGWGLARLAPLRGRSAYELIFVAIALGLAGANGYKTVRINERFRQTYAPVRELIEGVQGWVGGAGASSGSTRTFNLCGPPIGNMMFNWSMNLPGPNGRGRRIVDMLWDGQVVAEPSHWLSYQRGLGVREVGGCPPDQRPALFNTF